MAKRRLKNADEAMMGPQPSFGVHNPIPDDLKERERLFRNGCYWFYYFENKKKAAETVQTYCTRILKFDKKKIANLKKFKLKITGPKEFEYKKKVVGGNA